MRHSKPLLLLALAALLLCPLALVAAGCGNNCAHCPTREACLNGRPKKAVPCCWTSYGPRPNQGECGDCDCQTKENCAVMAETKCACATCVEGYKLNESGECVLCSEFPADVIFMADCTGSMGPFIDAVKAGAAGILTALGGAISDIRFGVASYLDFDYGGFAEPYVFQLSQDLTTDTALVTAAINSWVLGGGGDIPEANLYALWKVAQVAQFRPGASKVVCMFGDMPSHNPICPSVLLNGLPVVDIPPGGLSIENVAADLAAANIKVVSIDVGQLNGPWATPYAECPPPPEGYVQPAQGDYLASATGGLSVPGIDETTIVNAIIQSVQDAACSG